MTAANQLLMLPVLSFTKQRSTFFANALSPERLRQQTLNFCPKLNDKNRQHPTCFLKVIGRSL